MENERDKAKKKIEVVVPFSPLKNLKEELENPKYKQATKTTSFNLKLNEEKSVNVLSEPIEKSSGNRNASKSETIKKSVLKKNRPKYLLKLANQKLKVGARKSTFGAEEKESQLVPSFVVDSIAEVKIRDNLIKSPTEQLIEELMKPTKSHKKQGWGKNIVVTDRDPTKICYLLKMIPGFLKFVRYHQIADESIRKASEYFKFRKYKGGEFVYAQESKSTHFYGIITGTVKIYKAKKVLVHAAIEINKKSSKNLVLLPSDSDRYSKSYAVPELTWESVNEEFGTKSKGMCFGYDGLISKKPRSSTVIAFENTEMFTLDEKSFDESFNRCINRSEHERKEFLISHIKAFEENRLMFEQVFKNIRPKFLSKGDIIHKEGSKAEAFYVIYMGECILEKKIKLYKNKKASGSYNLIHSTVLCLSKGDFSGLEALFNTKDKPVLYEYSLIANNEYTVVLEVMLEKLPMFKEGVIQCLLPLKEKKDNIINKIVSEKHNAKSNLEITYHREQIYNKIHFDNENIQKECEEAIRKIKDHRPVPSNDFSNYSSVFNINRDVINKKKGFAIKAKLVNKGLFKPFISLVDSSLTQMLQKKQQKLESHQSLAIKEIISEVSESSRRGKIETDIIKQLDKEKEKDLKEKRGIYRENSLEPSFEVNNTSQQNFLAAFKDKFSRKPSNPGRNSALSGAYEDRNSFSFKCQKESIDLTKKMKHSNDNNTEYTGRNRVLSIEKNILSTRDTKSSFCSNLNVGEISPTIKRTIQLFTPTSASTRLTTYRTQRFSMPLITLLEPTKRDQPKVI